MPKRRPNSTIEPLDIFESPRLNSAMTAATSPEPLRPPVSAAQESTPEEGGTALRSVPPAPESEPTERVNWPSVAAEPAPKHAETGVTLDHDESAFLYANASVEAAPNPEKL